MGGNQSILQPRVVQTKSLEQILKSRKDDTNWTITKIAHNAESGSNSLEQMLALNCV